MPFMGAGKDTLLVVAVGDVMLGTAYPDSTYLPLHNNCDKLFDPLRTYLQDSDITFGNLEGALTDVLDSVKTCKKPENCYAFAMPTTFSSCLKNAGFDLMSLANNHVGDFGDTGRFSTMRALECHNIAYAGLEYCPRTIVERNGLKIGFCAFSPNSGTCKINNYSLATSIVRELDSVCDVVIVSFHGGAEGATKRNVTKETEIYLGEDRGNVYEFARLMIDAGADILLGHGPHVTRAVDLYKGRFIAYSLGNFCTYSRMSLKGPNGIAPLLKIYTNRQGEFIKSDIISTYQDYGFPPRIDSLNRALEELQILTAEDFPRSPLHVSDNGTISIDIFRRRITPIVDVPKKARIKK